MLSEKLDPGVRAELTPDALACGAMAAVFQCQHLPFRLHRIGDPRREDVAQNPIHFENSSARKDKNPEASQIVQIC